MKTLKYIGFGILGAGLVVFAVWLTMTLWNWLIPELFHGPVITFWQTAGLFILSKILFAGISPKSHRRPYSDYSWHRNYKSRYHRCTEEQPEAVKEGEEGASSKNKDA